MADAYGLTHRQHRAVLDMIRQPAGGIDRQRLKPREVPPRHFVFQTPSSGIPAISGSTPGSAICDVYFVNGSGDLTSAGFSHTVYNMAGLVAADTYIQATMDGFGVWWVTVEACT